MNNSALKNEVWNCFYHIQTIQLATIDGNSPRVRPVTMIFLKDRFWVCTWNNEAKVKQIRANPNMEICMMLSGEKEQEGYIRGSGMARIVDEMDTKKLVAESVSFFNNYFDSPDDPKYALIELSLNSIEYLRPGEFIAERFNL